MKVIIRRAEQSDYKEIVPLLSELWEKKEVCEAACERILLETADDGAYALYVAESDDGIVGFCETHMIRSLWQEGATCLVLVMVVRSTCRNRGIGRRLLEEAEREARLSGCLRIELESGFPRVGAHAFYEKLGYEKRAYWFSRSLNKRPES